MAVAASLLIAGGADARQQTSPVPSPMSDFYAYTGTPQTFVVPDGVTSATVQAVGARGFGFAAAVSGVLAVQPGEPLTVMVGGVPTGAAGGYNGGGAGGSPGGGGGGGASDVRTGSDPATRLIVAGGGGGSSGVLPISGYNGSNPSTSWFPYSGGGAAGAAGPAGVGYCTQSLPSAIGQTAGFCGGIALVGGAGGAAGANGIGGVGGTPGSGSGTAGGSGDAAGGGAGADGSGVAGGGGGGGGGYGGGGGGGGAIPPAADTGVDNPGVPIAQGGGGGGGGSYAPGGTIAPAPFAAEASVTITYTPPLPPQQDSSAAANVGPAPAPAPAAPATPKAALSRIESVHARRDGQAVVARIHCQVAPSACHDTADLLAHVADGSGAAHTTRVVVVGSERLTIPRTKSASLTIPLNARGRALLKQRGHLNVKVSVRSGQDPAALSSILSLAADGHARSK